MTTMDKKYGDGSNHEVCEHCDMCLDCGDCVCKDRLAPWYTGFVSKRMEHYIEEDDYAYQCYGITILPDWIIEQGKEIKTMYDSYGVY